MKGNLFKIMCAVTIFLLFPLNAHSIELKLGSCGLLSTMFGISHFKGKVGVEYLVCDGSDEFTSSSSSFIFGHELPDDDTIYFHDQYLNLLFSFSGQERKGAYVGIGMAITDGKLKNNSSNETVKSTSSGISIFLGYDYGWLSGRVGWISDGLLEFEVDTGGGTTEIESLERNGLFQLLLNIPL